MQAAIRVHHIDWDNWRPTDHAVLCFVRSDSQLLLIHKKRGLGKGKINGPGGRIEPDETAQAAAIRETREEVGLTPLDPVEQAELRFQFTDGYAIHLRVFFADHWTGKLMETDEALPFWCPTREIPYDRMWADDRLWLPPALQGARVHGRFIFDGDTMIDHLVERQALPGQSR